MSFTINIYYTGENESAKKFAKEMVEKGLVERVRAEKVIRNMNISFQWMIQKQFY